MLAAAGCGDGDGSALARQLTGSGGAAAMDGALQADASRASDRKDGALPPDAVPAETDGELSVSADLPEWVETTRLVGPAAMLMQARESVTCGLASRQLPRRSAWHDFETGATVDLAGEDYWPHRVEVDAIGVRALVMRFQQCPGVAAAGRLVDLGTGITRDLGTLVDEQSRGAALQPEGDLLAVVTQDGLFTYRFVDESVTQVYDGHNVTDSIVFR